MKEIYLVLHNIRSCYNVGAILRTAEGFGVSRVIFSGITPRVDDIKLLPHLREKINHQIGKSALGAERMVEKYSSDDIIKDLLRLKEEEGFVVVGLENNIEDDRVLRVKKEKIVPLLREKEPGSVGFEPFGVSEVSSALEKPVALVLGEEVDGINYALRDICDVFLDIPMYGKKESFNVSVATGIALFILRELM